MKNLITCKAAVTFFTLQLSSFMLSKKKKKKIQIKVFNNFVVINLSVVITFRRHTNTLRVASKQTKMEEAVRKENILVSKFRFPNTCRKLYGFGHTVLQKYHQIFSTNYKIYLILF